MSATEHTEATIIANKRATTLQALWRGRAVRKQYSFEQAGVGERYNSETFVVGNDPKITGLEAHIAVEGKIALIGTSGLRSLSLVCELGKKTPAPKLIIVDISKQVVKFWRSLRTLVETNDYPSKQAFIIGLKHFLRENKSLWREIESTEYIKEDTETVKYENQNPLVYMKRLIEQYGLDTIMSIIKNTTVICQTWEDETLFHALKNILKHNGVESTYLYASNIIDCMLYEEEADMILKNIEQISPRLTIFTDLDPTLKHPAKVTLSTEHSATENKRLARTQSFEPSLPFPRMPHGIEDLVALIKEKFKGQATVRVVIM